VILNADPPHRTQAGVLSTNERINNRSGLPRSKHHPESARPQSRPVPELWSHSGPYSRRRRRQYSGGQFDKSFCDRSCGHALEFADEYVLGKFHPLAIDPYLGRQLEPLLVVPLKRLGTRLEAAWRCTKRQLTIEPFKLRDVHRTQLEQSSHFPSRLQAQDPDFVASPYSPYQLACRTGTPRSRDNGSDISAVKSQMW